MKINQSFVRGGRKFISVALCLIMMFTTFFIFDPSVLSELFPKASAWNFTSYATSTNGDKSGLTINTSAKTATVNTSNGFAYFLSHVTEFQGYTITLNTDVYLQPSQGSTSVNYDYNDSDTTAWYGVLDGNGHCISNYYHHYSSNPKRNLNHHGIIRKMSGGIIRNLTVLNPHVYSYNSRGYTVSRAGGLIGTVSSDSCSYSDVKIENVTVSGAYVNLAGEGGKAGRSVEEGGIVGFVEKKTTFTNCKVVNSKIQQDNWGQRQGGFVGQSTAEIIIQNDTKTTAVDSNTLVYKDNSGDSDHGGLIAWTSGNTTINNVIFEGKVYGGDTCGGFIGYTNGNVTITNSDVKGYIRGVQYGGGFVGFADSADGKTNTVRISNGTNYATIASRDDNAGGFIGKNVSNVYFTDCANRGAISNSNCSTAAGFIGWNNNGSNAISFRGCNNYGSVTSGNYAGGFLGADGGSVALTFSDTHNYGAINGAERTGGFIGGTNRAVTFTGCTNENTVTGTSDFVGGFIGFADSSNALSFTNCTNKSNVSASGTDAGGMFGKTSGYVTKIDNCHNTATITASGSSAGGMFGYIQGNGRGSTVLKITNCTNTGAISSTSNNGVGGLVGSSDMPVNISGGSNTGKITGGQYVGGIAGIIKNGTITITDSNNTGTIYARSGFVGGIVGNVAPSDAAGAIIRNCKNTATSFTANGENIGGILGKNEADKLLTIDNCHNTSIINVAQKWVGGLVGYDKGELVMKNSSNTANVTGRQHTGGLIAGIEDDGCSITNCLNTGDVSTVGNSNGAGIVATIESQTGSATWTISNTVNTGNISGVSALGGFVGYLGNLDKAATVNINNSVNKGNVTSTGNDVGGFVGNIYNHGSTTQHHKYTNLYNYGNISSNSTGDTFVGGIVGKEYGFCEFNGCENYGSVTESATSGNNIAGGIVGWIQDDTSSVQNCVNYGKVSGRNNVGGIVGEFSTGSSSNLTITGCGNYGTLEAKNAGTTQIGGIMGRFSGNTIYISKCFNGNGVDGAIASSSAKGLYAGGIIGYGTTIYVADSYNNAPSVYGNTSGGLVGWCNNTVYLYNSYNKTSTGITTQYSGNKTPSSTAGCYTNTISTGTSAVSTLNTSRTVSGIGSVGNAYTYKEGVNKNYPALSWQLNTLTKNVGRNLIADLIADTAKSGFTASGATYSIKLDGITKTYNYTYTKTVNGVTVTYDTLTDTFMLNGTPSASGTFNILSVSNPDAKSVYTSVYYVGGNAFNCKVNVQSNTVDRTSGRHAIDSVLAGSAVTVSMNVTSNTPTKFDNYKFHASMDYVNNAVGSHDSSADLHSTYSGLGTPTKTGYNFLGWYNQRNSGTKITEGSTVVNSGTPNFSDKLDRDVDIYAHWDPITYTVIYDGNGATSGSTASSTHTYDEAKNLTPNGFKHEYTVNFDYNYSGATVTTATATSTFNGWVCSKDGKTYGDGASVINLTTVDKDTITMTAQWTEATVTLPSASRTGYKFDGWYTAAEGGTRVTDSAFTPNKNGITLYAHWTPITYTVNYNGNAATSGSTASSSHTYDIAKNLTENGFKRDIIITFNYNDGVTANSRTTLPSDFSGWANSANGAAIYSDKENVVNLTSVDNSTVTLYAKWNDSSVTLPNPTRKGHTFNGWFDESGNKVSGTITPTQNVMLTAHWDAITYTVIYDGNGATSGSTASSIHTYGVEKALTPNGFSRSFNVIFDNNDETGTTSSETVTSTFNGWSTVAGGSSVYANGEKVVNLSEKAGDSVKLYANWNDGTLTLPEDPTRTGYTFRGWFTAAVGGSKIENGSTISSDRTIYAHWDINSYIINFINGETVLQSSSWNYNTTPQYNGAIPTKASDSIYEYTFSGWSPTIEKVTADATYVAQFTSKAHDYKYVVVDDTQHKHVCNNCGYEEAAENHNFVYTRLENGLGYAYVCRECGFSYTEEAVKYEITVPTNCTVSQTMNLDLSVNYYVATITAPLKVGNKYFVYWVDSDGAIVTTYRTYSFFATDNYSFTPVYVTEDKYTAERNSAVITSRVLDCRSNGDDTYSILVEHSVAKTGGSINGHGVLYTTDSSQAGLLTVDNDNIEKKAAGLSSRVYTGLLEITVEPGSADTIWARSYVIDTNGTVHYGDTKSYNLSAATSSVGDEMITLNAASFDLTEMNVEDEAPTTPSESENNNDSLFGIIPQFIAKLLDIINTIISLFKNSGVAK